MQSELHYTQLPVDPITENWDLSTFTEQQLRDFYWDHPESIPDEVMFGYTLTFAENH